MNSFRLSVFLCISISILSCTKRVTENESIILNDNIYQYGTMQKFLDKNYDGNLSISELKKKGDFGLGTFNGVNGEMVVSDGNVYRILPDGAAFEVSETDLTPFTVVKFFKPDTSITISKTMNLDELRVYLTNIIPDSTKPVAIKITGEFEKVKTRTVEQQHKPYPALQEIVANQIEFNFENVKGSAIGFWFPPYIETVNFPGYHFHFLKDGLSGGGHLLNCTISNVTVEFDYPDELVVGF